MPHGLGSKCTWGGRMKVLALFRCTGVYGKCCMREMGIGEKRGWALLGAVMGLGLGRKGPWGLALFTPGF
nr:hypothetical protein [Tanacetum cinerariifolium]